MLDDSNEKQPSNMTLDEIIDILVEKTRTSGEKSEDYSIIKKLDDYLDVLESAFEELSELAERKKIASSGVEWFLDNYHVTQQAVELIRDDLPESYFNKLPPIEDKDSTPRIYHIARAMIAYFEVELVRNDLHAFIDSFQEKLSLNMSELWALPLMLRLGLIEVLAGTIFELLEEQTLDKTIDHVRLPDMEPDEVVARALRTLLLFDRVNWKKFFEDHSLVNKVLREDPMGIYPKMDFDTRDEYRKKIEALADNSNLDEVEIAEKVVTLAQPTGDKSNYRNHIGYYLVDEGQTEIKTAIQYQADFFERFRKFFFNHGTVIYLGSIALITVLVVLGLLLYSQTNLLSNWYLILIGVLILVPASSVAVNLINSILTATLPPRILPKMDFRKKVPAKHRTVVVIPAILPDQEELAFVLQQLELHYLANKDPNIGFALLSDLKDAAEETLPEDEEILEAAIDGINGLNERYRGDQGRRPFYLFHRLRQWNPKENAWMGWERKRGKLDDFNSYLLEGFEDSFEEIIGDEKFLKKARYVITVDADTVLPRDSANSLIATMAHPLNQAEFEEGTSKVTRGYTILQPRTEVKPTSVNKSLFTRIFAGDLGLDLYTRAVSDVYQDMFGEGIYVGKGLYNVAAFHRSLKNKVPENTLLSHDLFEGIQGRAALISDIVFFEEYPPNYSSQVNRLHRWVRGDWQLLPWLFPRVPARGDKSEPNPFSAIDLWKILDNLRRSLLSPAALLSLVTGWVLLENNAWVWTLLVLLVTAFPLFKNIVTSISSRFIIGAKANLLTNISSAFYRWIFWLIFLPYESLIMVDAIISTIVRVFISHERLLQWETASHTIRILGKERKIATIWQRMISAPLMSIAIGVIVFSLNQSAFWVNLPLLLLWLISPQIAYWISLPRSFDDVKPLDDTDRLKLRTIARRTWLYFERFIGPEDHWLPPDHFQEDPKGVVAHRTSPTNIGLLLLSSVAAYDFGYIGMLDFVYRMNYAFETLDEMEKYRGHLFNWYDTRTLDTLKPRYVSAVDSGNYAASLVGLYQALADLDNHSICAVLLYTGAFDTLEVLCEVVNEIDSDELNDVTEKLQEHCRKLQKDLFKSDLNDSRQMELLEDFRVRLSEPMNVLIKNVLDSEKFIGESHLQDIHYWSDAIFQHLANIQKQIAHLAPWMAVWQNRPDFLDEQVSSRAEEAFAIWFDDHALQISLKDLPEQCEKTIEFIDQQLNQQEIDELESLDDEQIKTYEDWLEQFKAGLEESKSNAADLISQIHRLMEKIEFHLDRMEFEFLMDKQREVFFLGYQVGSGRLDRNHYDLLASEARTASLYAIAQNQVSRSHWLHMGRPFTDIANIPTLVSWNGSMFEYLMPNLYTRTYPETLLHQTSKGVVQAQMDYGRKKNVPWGISESSYYRFDRADNYQYKGFGVPGLGRKRGLANDLVITPYASLLAVGVNPQAVLDNIEALREEGAMGHYGFFESIDYTPSRLPVGQDRAIIKSYMAHHQGMIMVALANFLNEIKITDRIHQDPRIQSTELLLQEQIPEIESAQAAKEVSVSIQGRETEDVSLAPWRVDPGLPGKAVHMLSNENLRLLMSESGSGYLAWKDIALTRWRNDGTLDSWGIWFYIQDLTKGSVWSIGKRPILNHPQDYEVIYAPHMIEIRKITDDTQFVMQVTIMPNEDICLHRIELTNNANEERHYRVLSYGEVVLAPQATDRQHPAFNKLFIESHYDKENQMLFFKRRKRSAKEDPRAMAHLLADDLDNPVEFETDREKFIGRGNALEAPMAITQEQELSGTDGITLDPIFSLGKRVKLLPNEKAQLTFITIPAEEETEAKKLAEYIIKGPRIENAFSSAESSSEKLLRALEIKGENLPQYQTLLSHILYPLPTLRSDPDAIAKNDLGQSGLWPFGISGDYPILLILANHKDQIEELQNLIHAHIYWRKLGLMIDLVILNTKDAGYTHELNEKIHKAISVMEAQGYVNQRGGIFVLTASQMETNVLNLLKAAGSVVLDLSEEDLDGHLDRAKEIEPHLPSFTPTGPGEEFPDPQPIKRPENLILDNGIGGFTPDGREYQIYLENYPKNTHEPGQATPAPWVNVIANRDFGFLVTEAGGGYTWSENSGENRLTPWTNDKLSDPSGEALYLRDEINGKVWSPTPYPSGKGVNYLVRHGQGYSVFESKRYGFEQSLTFHTDAEAPVKVIRLTLVNQSNRHRRITATYFAEWILSPHRDMSMPFIVPDYEGDSESLLARNPYSAEFSERVAFLTSDQPIHGLTTDRKEFLGENGSRENPAALKRVGLSGRVEAGRDPCAALQVHLNFKPDEKKTITFVLGQGADEESAHELAKSYSDPEVVEKSWHEARKSWDVLLNTIQVETPEPDMDLILNRWLPYQTLSSRIWGRTGFFQSSGAYGYRDQLQDVMSVLMFEPEIAREHILRAARHQFDAGDVLHWWHPPSGRGVRTRITDDLLWLVYVTAEYVKRTGDTDILTEEVPFRVGDPLTEDEEERYGHYDLTEKAYSIFEHCRRALERGDTKGPHGLPLIGGGDWNDGMNRVGIEGKGESVWLAWFLYSNHLRFAELCKIMGEDNLAVEHQERADEIRDVINQVAWDGDWYLRGYYDDGRPLGSHANQECQIDSLPQSWAVLTRGAPEDRQQKVMEAVKDRLVQEEGKLIRLFKPPFDKTEHDPGYIKGYPPGVRENGGQYTHAAIWAVWALRDLGQGDEAFRLFSFLNPVTHSLDIDEANRYTVEPYAVAADIYSMPPFVGMGGWTWYTGSSGWLYRLGVEGILGFTLEGDHFRIDPCIPKEWDGFKLTYLHDGTTYEIEVRNPDHVQIGVSSLSLDGEDQPDLIIPKQDDQDEHKIVVIMGRESNQA